MAINNLDLLTEESVSVLRQRAHEDASIAKVDLDELIDRFSLKTWSSDYVVDESLSLRNPDLDLGVDFDVSNSIEMMSALPGLVPAMAIDERLWVTLSFGIYAPYCRARWGKESRDSAVENNVEIHWFARSSRQRYRDNAIGRLWWQAYWAKRIAPSDPSSALKVLGINSDLRGSLLERTSLSTAPKLASAIVDVSRLLFLDEKVPYDRHRYRNFIKRIDSLAGRRVFSYLAVDDLRSELEAELRVEFK